MKRYAKLTHTSNPSLQEFVGHEGELTRNKHGGYDFVMKDIDKTIRTTASRQGTVLGDVDNPICRNIGFQTRSGTHYMFEFMDVEKLHDGVRRVDNTYVGFEHSYSLEDKMNNASQRAGEFNETHNDFSKGSVDKEFSY